jgi:hypothetical protein
MKISDRYASAINSSNLLSIAGTTFSDTDVLGALALASRKKPLAVALARLLYGDNKAAAAVVAILEDLVWRQARRMGAKCHQEGARGIAQAALGWYRHGACKACHGHGRMLIPGSTVIGERECSDCHGAGRVPFERQFRQDQRNLARWAAAQIEREQSHAWPAAMMLLVARGEKQS